MKRTFLAILVLMLLSMSQMVVSASSGSVAYVRFANDRPNCSGVGSLIIGVTNATNTPNYLTVSAGVDTVRTVEPDMDTVFVTSANTTNVFNGVVRVIVSYGSEPYARDYFYGVYWFNCFSGQLITPEINANDDNYSVYAEYTSNFNLVGNDTSNLGFDRIWITQQPRYGSVRINNIYSAVYTPVSGFTGIDTFSYRICNAAYCSNADVTIYVNRLPTAALLSANMSTNTCSTTGTLSGEVVFAGGEAFVSATSSIQDTHNLTSFNAALVGTRNYSVDVSGEGILVDNLYYPVHLQYGTMPFDGEFYDQTLWFDCVTGLPIAPVVEADDDTVTVPENFPKTFDVLSNDESLLSLDPTSVQIIVPPTRGTVTVDDAGNLTYTYGSDDNFTGTDTLTYEVCDVAGFCGNATVTITIDDLPEHVIYGATVTPQTCESTGTAQINVEYSGHTAILTAMTGITSIADISSDDIETFGEQTIDMQVSGLDGGVVGDNVLILNVDYGTAANDTSYDSKTFYFDCVTGEEIFPIVDARDDDFPEMGRNLPTSIDVLDNDESRLPFDLSTLQIISQPPFGTVEVVDGMPVYTGDGISLGDTSFTYRICNLEGFCDIATVWITIVNLPPVCEGSSTVFHEVWPPNQSLVPIVIQGVYDPDGDPVTFELTRVTIYENDTIQEMDPDEVDYDAENGLIRAERLGNGGGRIYVVEYQATDPDAQFCDGTAYIYVPHDQRHHGCEVPSVDIDGNPFPELPETCDSFNNGNGNGQNNGNGNGNANGNNQGNNSPPTSEPSEGNNNGLGNNNNVGNAQGNPPRNDINPSDTGDVPTEPSDVSTPVTPTDTPEIVVEEDDGQNNGLGNDGENGNAQGDPQRDNNNGNGNANGNAYGHSND